MERRGVRGVSQNQPTAVISEEGSLAAYVRLAWIHEAAEEASPHGLDGSRACEVDGGTGTSDRRSEWNHKPKSRMREIRTSGSEGGLSPSTDWLRST